MQSVKSMVVVGCLLVAATAHAWEWDSDVDDDGWIDPPPVEENDYHQRFMAEMRERQQEAERQYYQTKPWREYNEMRNACNAITGNDAARADCFRGLGGW